MLTRNFYQYLGALFARAGNSAIIKATLTKHDGTTAQHSFSKTTSVPYALLGAMVHPSSTNIPSAGTWKGTWFGTGSTPATVDDYMLESPIKDGSLTFNNATAITVADNSDHLLCGITYSVTNTGETDQAVSEIGVFSCDTDSGTTITLLDHTVLAEPIVIRAKQTVPITYEIKFPYGT